MPGEYQNFVVTEATGFREAKSAHDLCFARMCCFDAIITIAVLGDEGVIQDLSCRFQGQMVQPEDAEGEKAPWHIRVLRQGTRWLCSRLNMALAENPAGLAGRDDYNNPTAASYCVMEQTKEDICIQLGVAFAEPLLCELHELYRAGKVNAWSAYWSDPEDFPQVKLRYPECLSRPSGPREDLRSSLQLGIVAYGGGSGHGGG